MGGTRPAVFLDRDGVLTREAGHVTSADRMEVFPYAADCVSAMRRKGYLAVVVTNQSGVARGILAEGELAAMNDRLIRETGVDAVYCCPHHPDGIVARHRRACACRKPGTGMIDEACVRLGIDTGRSYMVGDRACDIIAGQNAGLATVLLESGYGTARLEEAVKPDHTYRDLRDFAEALPDAAR